MKAVVRPRYGSPDVLQLTEIAKPEPDDGEVLIEVNAASVGAWDWHYLAADPHLMRLAGEGFLKPKVPVAGLDVAGRVEAVGSGVTRFRPGDAVYGKSNHGSLAEYTCASENTLGPKPAHLTFEQAAAIPVAASTALQGLRDVGRLESGQRVLIIGASGGVGTFATQIAVAMGAEVTGIGGPDSTELIRSLGAEHLIDYTQQDIADIKIRYDLILQLAGTLGPLELRRLLTQRGTLVLSSGEGGPWIGPLARNLTAMLVSPFVTQRLRAFVEDLGPEHLRFLGELAEAGQLTPVIDRSYPLEQAADALRHLKDGHSRGKTIIAITEPMPDH